MTGDTQVDDCLDHEVQLCYKANYDTDLFTQFDIIEDLNII